MLDLLYLNEPRVTAVYSQLSQVVERATRERSHTRDAKASGGFKAILEAALGSSRTERLVEEVLTTPEQRLAFIIQEGRKSALVSRVPHEKNWQQIERGDCVLVSGVFVAQEVRGLSEDRPTLASEAEPLGRLFLLLGVVDRVTVEVPFSQRHVKGESAMYTIRRLKGFETELAGVVTACSGGGPVALHALAFGTGLIRAMGERTETLLTAETDVRGWLTCPGCGKRFAAYNPSSWNGSRHQSCGQRIALKDNRRLEE